MNLPILHHLFHKQTKSLEALIPYDPKLQIPVIHASICTGEKVAGFKDKATGYFTEVMLLRTLEDEQTFKSIYHLDHVKTEY